MVLVSTLMLSPPIVSVSPAWPCAQNRAGAALVVECVLVGGDAGEDGSQGERLMGIYPGGVAIRQNRSIHPQGKKIAMFTL